jgi:hypothetical protein
MVEKIAYKMFCGEQGRRPEYQFNYQVSAKSGTLCVYRCPYLHGPMNRVSGDRISLRFSLVSTSATWLKMQPGPSYTCPGMHQTVAFPPCQEVDVAKLRAPLTELYYLKQ